VAGKLCLCMNGSDNLTGSVICVWDLQGDLSNDGPTAAILQTYHLSLGFSVQVYLTCHADNSINTFLIFSGLFFFLRRKTLIACFSGGLPNASCILLLCLLMIIYFYGMKIWGLSISIQESEFVRHVFL